MTLHNPSLETASPPPAIVRMWSRQRIFGMVMCLLWAMLGVYLVWSVIIGADREVVAKYLPKIISGLWVTLEIVALSIGLGMLVAIPVALARLSPSRIVSSLAFAYVYFFRGTPLLAQVFLVYYGAGQLRVSLEDAGLWWFFREAFNCVVATFTLNTAAYQAEIYAGAIRSVPHGQREAAQALGLHRAVIFARIVAPQAAIIALRPLGNEIILMVKSSAIASVVTIFDLMGSTQLAFSRTYDFNVYIWAAIVYLSLVEALRFTWDWLERRMTRHLRRDNG